MESTKEFGDHQWSDTSELWNSCKSDLAQTDPGSWIIEETISCIGSMVIRHLAISEFRKQLRNSNTMPAGQGGEDTWNSLYVGATLVADIERGRHAPEVPWKMESDSLAPFQKVHIDLTGPHRRSAGRHVYLLTGICWLYQVPRCGSSQRQECTYCGECITETWLSDLWCGGTPSPRQWNWVCKLDFSAPIQNDGDSGSQKHRLSPRSELSDRTHSPNTQCCIHKKTIKEHQRDWHEQAKYVCFAYNTAKHSSTTSSPFYSVFLREPKVRIDLFLDQSEPVYQDSDKYAETVRERMQRAYRIVSEQLKATFDRAKRR